MDISLFSIVFCFSVLAFADPVVLPVNQNIPESSWFEQAPELAKKFVQDVGFALRNIRIVRNAEKIAEEVTSSEIWVLLPQSLKRALGSVSENPLFALADKLAADRWLQDKADTHKKHGGSTNSDTPTVFNQKNLREHVNAYAVLQSNKDADVEVTNDSTEDSNAKLPPEHQHQGPMGWQAPGQQTASSDTSQPGAATMTQTPATAQPITPLGCFVERIRSGEIYCARLTIPEHEDWRMKPISKMASLGSFHPNSMRVFSITWHRDHRTTIHTELADAGPLSNRVALFQPELRVGVAKAVAKQVLLALSYFDIVHGLAHRNVCPSTVFLLRDGCVKLGFFGLINPSVVRYNPTWYNDSPYCAPEIRNDVEARCNSGSTADVWAVGTLILAIVTGKTLQPKVNKTRLEVPTQEQETAYRSEQLVFKKLVMEGSDEDWKQAIPDDLLRHLCRRCLHLNPQDRASPIEAVALTFLFGGVANNEAMAAALNPWATEIGALVNNAAPQQPAPSSPAASAAAHATESADVAPAPNGSNTISSAGPKILEVIKKPFKFTKGTDLTIEGTNAKNLNTIIEALVIELEAVRAKRESSRSDTETELRNVVRARSSLAWKAVAVAVDQK